MMQSSKQSHKKQFKVPSKEEVIQQIQGLNKDIDQVTLNLIRCDFDATENDIKKTFPDFDFVEVSTYNLGSFKVIFETRDDAIEFIKKHSDKKILNRKFFIKMPKQQVFQAPSKDELLKKINNLDEDIEHVALNLVKCEFKATTKDIKKTFPDFKFIKINNYNQGSFEVVFETRDDAINFIKNYSHKKILNRKFLVKSGRKKDFQVPSREELILQINELEENIKQIPLNLIKCDFGATENDIRKTFTDFDFVKVKQYNPGSFEVIFKTRTEAIQFVEKHSDRKILTRKFFVKMGFIVPSTVELIQQIKDLNEDKYIKQIALNFVKCDFDATKKNIEDQFPDFKFVKIKKYNPGSFEVTFETGIDAINFIQKHSNKKILSQEFFIIMGRQHQQFIKNRNGVSNTKKQSNIPNRLQNSRIQPQQQNNYTENNFIQQDQQQQTQQLEIPSSEELMQQIKEAEDIEFIALNLIMPDLNATEKDIQKTLFGFNFIYQIKKCGQRSFDVIFEARIDAIKFIKSNYDERIKIKMGRKYVKQWTGVCNTQTKFIELNRPQINGIQPRDQFITNQKPNGSSSTLVVSRTILKPQTEEQKKELLRLTKAQTQLQNLSRKKHLSQRYFLQLKLELESISKQQKIQAWFDAKIKKLVMQETIKSIQKLVNQIDNENAFLIQVKNNQLDIFCRYKKGGKIGSNKYSVFEITSLMQTILNNFDPIKFTKQSIPKKIQEIFNKLYQCFKIFLLRQLQSEKLPIDEVEFLIFSSSYLKSIFEGSGLDYTTKNESIIIGGLVDCCFKFFRTLFAIYFQYMDFFLLPEINQQTKDLFSNNKNQVFIRACKEQIQRIFSQINKYEEEILDNQTTAQIGRFISQKKKFPFRSKVYNSCQQKYHTKDMEIHITQKGQILMTNPRNIDFPIKEFQIFREEIRKLNQKQIQMAEAKKKQDLEKSLANMKIIGKPSQAKIVLDYKYKIIDYNHMYELSHRKTFTYRKQKQSVKQQQAPRTTLKILTWNILGYRQRDSIKQPTQKEKDQLRKMEQQRFRDIIVAIKQHDPDFVCLQEVYALVHFNFDLFQQNLIKGLQGQNYYFAQYNKNLNDIPSDKYRNQRTMILSKFPVKFSNLLFKYKNFDKAQLKDVKDLIGVKIQILAQFQLQISPLYNSYNSLNVLIASVHLKSGNGRQSDLIRAKQFQILHKLGQDFNICIFAGDFNTYDQPNTQYENLSSVGKLIKDYKYIDFENYLTKEEPTYNKVGYDRTMIDKILIKIGNTKELEPRFHVNDVKYPGSFAWRYSDNKYQNLKQQNGFIRNLSDHIGRFVEFSFKKN